MSASDYSRSIEKNDHSSKDSDDVKTNEITYYKQKNYRNPSRDNEKEEKFEDQSAKSIFAPKVTKISSIDDEKKTDDKDENKTHDEDENKTHDKDENKTHDEDENKSHDKDENKTHDEDENKTHDKDENKTHNEDENKTHDKDENKTHNEDENKTHDKDENKTHDKDENKTHVTDENKTHDEDENKISDEHNQNILNEKKNQDIQSKLKNHKEIKHRLKEIKKQLSDSNFAYETELKKNDETAKRIKELEIICEEDTYKIKELEKKSKEYLNKIKELEKISEEDNNKIKVLEKQSKEYSYRIKELENLKKTMENDKNKILDENNKLKTQNLAFSKKIEDLSNFFRNEQQKCREKQLIIDKLSYKSVGLANLGNSCYFNSVIQCLAHIDLSSISSTGQFSSKLMNLISAMKNKTSNENDLSNRLSTLYNFITSDDDNFSRGEQADPKYLLIVIQQKLLLENNNIKLYKWIKELQFIHTLSNRNNTQFENHIEKLPSQTVNVFILNPKYKAIVTQDFISSFNKYMSHGSCKNYCTKCETELVGEEYPIGLIEGNYILFSISQGKYSVELDRVSSFNYHFYEFELNSVILRSGFSNESGHNYAVCKEENNWVEYNDTMVSALNSSKIQGVYLFLFKVKKT